MENAELANKTVRELMIMSFRREWFKSTRLPNIPHLNLNIADIKTAIGVIRLSKNGIENKLCWFIPYEAYTCVITLTSKEYEDMFKKELIPIVLNEIFDVSEMD